MSFGSQFFRARLLAVVVLALVGGLVWYFQRSAERNRSVHAASLPLYADSATALANAAPAETRTFDYERYAGLVLPPLSPAKALTTFALEPGFRIEVVAHEPDVMDPIAMDIDRDGRLWVIEMSSYMPVHDRDQLETTMLERVPLGRIVVLEDTNGDGRMDRRWVFMDQLVLPRAIKVMDYGVLVAEPPNLWFIRDTTGDGVGDTKELVFDRYGNVEDYNVEHMPNGLMWGMDNWIHSTDTGVPSFRYVGGQWETRPFEQIGQWGITQDDWGRIYSSHNRRTLTTHFAPYGYSERHPLFRVREGMYSSIAESEAMWPAHPTGVNRGYLINEEVWEDGTLRRSTATAGAVIYRGHQFGDDYRGNAFVPEPAGNLIKRLVGLDEAPGEIEVRARFAYEEREFLTSTDERFRPVNLFNAPDGSIYVIDMYRGIFQHARYLTDHLRDYAVEHDLHEPSGMGEFGRIYRIVRDDRPIEYGAPRLSELAPDDLARYLTHRNGMLRDAAQQLLVQRSPTGAIPTLERFVRDSSAEVYTRLQALWTLAGFDSSRYSQTRLASVARVALDDEHPRVRAAAVRILEPELGRDMGAVLRRLTRMATEEPAPYTRLQLLASLGESNDPSALASIAHLLHENIDSPYFREIALTGVHEREVELIEVLQGGYGWRPGEDENKDWVLERLHRAVAESVGRGLQLSGEDLRLFSLGAQRYTACAVCHGEQGQGLNGVAPPLARSAWVRGEAEAVVRILLHGLTGSSVAGAVMPAHGFMSDEDLAGILTYVRQSWGNDAVPIGTAQVSATREATRARQEEWTPEELRSLSR